jgi:F0F1-type ATP synthase epsilon subunit
MYIQQTQTLTHEGAMTVLQGAIACLRQLDTQRSRLEFELEQLQNGRMRKAS